MTNPKIILLLLFGSLLFTSCQTRADLSQERQKIQSLMDKVHQAHFSKDAKEFYAPYGESWYDVRNGQVEKISKSEVTEGTQAYLDAMDFRELSNNHEPVIEISEDGSMASYLGAVTVKGIYSGQPVFWVVSWQSVLKKTGGNWEVISTANTRASAEVGAAVVLRRAKEGTWQFFGGKFHFCPGRLPGTGRTLPNATVFQENRWQDGADLWGESYCPKARGARFLDV